MEWSDFGPLVLQWLNLGDVEKDALSAVVKKVQDKQLNTEYQRRAEEAYSAFNNNFLETNLERVTTPLTDFLDAYVEKMSAHALMQHFNNVKQYNIDPNPWIIKHVKAWLPKMDLSLCSEYLKWLPAGEAKECVQSRLESLALDRSPKDVIWNAVKNSGWSQDEMAFLASVSVDSYQKWLLRENDPTTLQKLRSFMRFYSPNGTEPKDEACRRISAALHAMAAENSLHRLRASVYELLNAVDEVPGSKKD